MPSHDIEDSAKLQYPAKRMCVPCSQLTPKKAHPQTPPHDNLTSSECTPLPITPIHISHLTSPPIPRSSHDRQPTSHASIMLHTCSPDGSPRRPREKKKEVKSKQASPSSRQAFTKPSWCHAYFVHTSPSSPLRLVGCDGMAWHGLSIRRPTYVDQSRMRGLVIGQICVIRGAWGYCCESWIWIWIWI